MNRRFFISSSIAIGGVALLTQLPSLARPGSGTNGEGDVPAPGISATNPQSSKSKGIKKVIKTDAEWKAQLTPEQYNVLRQKGTEYAGTSPYTDLHDSGTFECAGCGLPLFSS